MAGIKDRDPQLTISQKIRSSLEQGSVLAQDIRNHVKSQVELWKKIPNWALEADGHSGYSDNNAKAYYHKIYPFHGRNPNSYIEIDLRTGTLRGPDDSILDVANKTDGFYDAKFQLDSLKRDAKSGYFGAYNPRKTAQWRADIRAKDPFLQETLDPSLTLDAQAQRLKGVISEIEKKALTPNSELNPEQVLNAIAHVLRASNFDDQEDGTQPIEVDLPRLKGMDIPLMHPPTRKEIRGAQEIMQCVALYIELRSSQFAPLFAKLSDAVWYTAVNATAKVRHERGMIHHRDPEWVYMTLGEEYIKRADGNEFMFAIPPKGTLKPDAKMGINRPLKALEVADWFLNTPAE